MGGRCCKSSAVSRVVPADDGRETSATRELCVDVVTPGEETSTNLSAPTQGNGESPTAASESAGTDAEGECSPTGDDGSECEDAVPNSTAMSRSLPGIADPLWSQEGHEALQATGRVLGSGVAGTVMLAARGGEMVAAKVFASSQQQDAEHEARLLRELGPHPCIVALHDVLYDLQWTVLVLQYCDQGSLHEMLCTLPAGETLPAPQQEDIIHDMLHGLSALHRQGVMHLDVKKDNVLLALGGGDVWAAVWCDLGEARVLPDNMLGGSDGGTPASFSSADFDPMPYYPSRRAPEVWRQEGIGQAADMWATGTIAAELITPVNLLLGTSEGEQLQLIDGLHSALTHMHEVEGSLSQPQWSLLSSLLTIQPSARASADAALAMPYFEHSRERKAIAKKPRKILKARRPQRAP